MRPLIPRARVGDILKGTKNLRSYLQAASTLNYLAAMSGHPYFNQKRAKKNLYQPTKSEEFLVTVNAWGMFGVCGLSSDAVLLFGNPRPQTLKQDYNAGIAPRRSAQFYWNNVKNAPSRSPRKTPSGKPKGSVRMSPTIFSKWFIRTSRKRTNLRAWPDFAHFMRIMLHMNLNNLPSEALGEIPRFRQSQGFDQVFKLRNQWGDELQPRRQLTHLLACYIPRGITRPAVSGSKYYMPSMPSGGFGPRLAELPHMQQAIRKLCTNPRIAHLLKSEGTHGGLYL